MEDLKLMEKAKVEFQKYLVGTEEKMSYADFECFLKNFFKEQPEVFKKLNIKEVFNEFSKEEKGKIDEREFRDAYKELKISKMNTSDHVGADDL